MKIQKKKFGGGGSGGSVGMGGGSGGVRGGGWVRGGQGGCERRIEVIMGKLNKKNFFLGGGGCQGGWVRGGGGVGCRVRGDGFGGSRWM